MPKTTTNGIVIPTADTEPADLYGVSTRLGQSVETVFCGPWTAVAAFSNSWVNYGSGEQDAQYRKSGDEVELRGIIKSGTTSTAFTLPAGYRPPEVVRPPIMQAGVANTGAASISIEADGDVVVNGYIGTGANTAVSLDGIRFSITA
jgi:hypothetical protein